MSQLREQGDIAEAAERLLERVRQPRGGAGAGAAGRRRRRRGAGASPASKPPVHAAVVLPDVQDALYICNCAHAECITVNPAAARRPDRA